MTTRKPFFPAIQNLSPFEEAVLRRLQVLESGRFEFPLLRADGESVYARVAREVFTADGTFTKADYPWAKSINVRVQAGGAAGGGAPTTSAGQVSFGFGGGGGGYAEELLNLADITATVTVTVGAGGAGNTGAAGDDGEDSSFGSYLSATGGTGGTTGGPTSTLPRAVTSGAVGGIGTGGDFNISGGYGGEAFAMAGESRGGRGGWSHMGGSIRPNTSDNAAGLQGLKYGGGGSGGQNNESQGTTRIGGAGGDGIVIVDLFG